MAAAPPASVVEISDDGKAWTVLRKVEGGNGGRDYLYRSRDGIAVPASRLLDSGEIAEGSHRRQTPGLGALDQRFLRQRSRRTRPRRLPPLVLRRAGVLDRRRRRRRWRGGAARRGRRAGGGAGGLLDRALPVHGWRADLLGRREAVAVPGGGISAHPHRDLDPRRSLAGDHRPGLGTAGKLRAPRPLSRPQSAERRSARGCSSPSGPSR